MPGIFSSKRFHLRVRRHASPSAVRKPARLGKAAGSRRGSADLHHCGTLIQPPRRPHLPPAHTPPPQARAEQEDEDEEWQGSFVREMQLTPFPGSSSHYYTSENGIHSSVPSTQQSVCFEMVLSRCIETNSRNECGPLTSSSSMM